MATFYQRRPSEFLKLDGLRAFLLDEAAAHFVMERQRLEVKQYGGEFRDDIR
ncbi:MAG: hypothetical protein DDT38_00993 [Firmicutes bacterium]|nr:hypothetical protein [candidate division NPL-UPA2 bacterium]